MPGLVGFTFRRQGESEAIKILRAMQKYLAYHERIKSDEPFCNEAVCAGRSHLDILQRAEQPYREGGIYVWLEGEFYNHEEMEKVYPVEGGNDPERLLRWYRGWPDFSFLKAIDGIYAAVIYDAHKKQVHLLSDRYGMRQLYWTVYDQELVWGSEVKAMLGLLGYTPKIDRVSVEQFMTLGQVLGERSWFEEVRILPAGTVLTWDMKERTITRKRYWWWDSIKEQAGELKEDEIAEELGRLFVDAVEKRSSGKQRVGLHLSGGLDSRAILASMPQNGYPIHAVTFGKKGCDDNRLAARTAALKGAVHHILEINAENWLGPRLEALWFTDGQLDIVNSHGIEAKHVSCDLFAVEINGLAGDVILGGSFLPGPATAEQITDDYAGVIAEMFHCDRALLEGVERYQGLTKSDYYFLENRLRRFTYEGLRHSLIEHRIPFFDNRLMEFVYTLPEGLRRGGHIYDKMLLRFFPDYYRDIPWQATGYPIGSNKLKRKGCELRRRVMGKLLRTAERVGIHLDNPVEFHDYPRWLRKEPARSFFEEKIKNKDALYPEYIPREMLEEEWQRHLAGENRVAVLSRAVSFEVWLQQVFNGKYRPDYDKAESKPHTKNECYACTV